MSSEYLKSVHWDLDIAHRDGFRVEFTGSHPYWKWYLKNKYSDEKIILYTYELFGINPEYPTRFWRFYDFAETPWGDMDVKSFKIEFAIYNKELKDGEEDPSTIQVQIEFY